MLLLQSSPACRDASRTFVTCSVTRGERGGLTGQSTMSLIHRSRRLSQHLSLQHASAAAGEEASQIWSARAWSLEVVQFQVSAGFHEVGQFQSLRCYASRRSDEKRSVLSRFRHQVTDLMCMWRGGGRKDKARQEGGEAGVGKRYGDARKQSVVEGEGASHQTNASVVSH